MAKPPLVPVHLAPNPVEQFYAGGGAVARFRGARPAAAPAAEDWVGSTTARWRAAPAGLSTLPDGRMLVEAVASDPEGYLGPAHLARWGRPTAVLVKLLDSAARLVVHCHPDRAFSRAHLGCAHGKTEAWIVLGSEGDGEVWVGFAGEVSAAELAAWVERQDTGDLLGSLNRLPVARGDAVLVPAGMPHAIGRGVLVLELQEPTDFSVLLEHQGPGDGAELGLGWDVALGCVDRSVWSKERLGALRGAGLGEPGRVLPAAADPFFRAELAREASVVAPGFAVAVAVSGAGLLAGDWPGGELGIRPGDTVLLPHAAGPVSVSGGVEVVVCRPPAPDAASPERPEV
ncbi:MAG: class I mannose-6-phosphate isomerase [Acidimicrobiales bacterium]